MLQMKLDGITITTTRSCRCNDGSSHTITITIDFTGCTLADLIRWCTSNRVISGQKQWERLSRSDLLELDGKTFSALNIGKKQQSTSEIMADINRLPLAERIKLLEQAVAEQTSDDNYNDNNE